MDFCLSKLTNVLALRNKKVRIRTFLFFIILFLGKSLGFSSIMHENPRVIKGFSLKLYGFHKSRGFSQKFCDICRVFKENP